MDHHKIDVLLTNSNRIRKVIITNRGLVGNNNIIGSNVECKNFGPNIEIFLAAHMGEDRIPFAPQYKSSIVRHYPQ